MRLVRKRRIDSWIEEVFASVESPVQVRRCPCFRLLSNSSRLVRTVYGTQKGEPKKEDYEISVVIGAYEILEVLCS